MLKKVQQVGFFDPWIISDSTEFLWFKRLPRIRQIRVGYDPKQPITIYVRKNRITQERKTHSALKP